MLLGEEICVERWHQRRVTSVVLRTSRTLRWMETRLAGACSVLGESRRGSVAQSTAALATLQSAHHPSPSRRTNGSRQAGTRRTEDHPSGTRWLRQNMT